MTHLITKYDYQSVLLTMRQELAQSYPNEAVLRSCKEFLAEAPLPLPDLATMKPEQFWSRA